MSELWEVAKLIRSKNASPWELTIDIMFDNHEDYQRGVAGCLSRETTYADIYHLEPSDIRVFLHEMALAIKVSMPRPTPAGGLGETDVFGGQFHSPLVHIDIDDPAPLALQEKS